MADLTVNEQFQRVVPIKIGETLCYPVFLCLRAKNPGHEQIQETCKDTDLQNKYSNNCSQKDKITQLQTNGWIPKCLQKARWTQNAMGVHEYDVFIKLGRNSPKISKRIGKNCRAIISLFRSAMNMNSFVEEF